MNDIFIFSDDGKKIKGIKDQSVKHIIIPNEVFCIGENSFRGCRSLKSVEISNNVTTISDNAFRECDSLEMVNIPDSVTSIGKAAFNGCRKLFDVTIPSNITSIGIGAFQNTPFFRDMEDGVIYMGRCLYLCKGKQSLNPDIVIKDGTVCILPRAFQYHDEIKSIIIPSSVTSIGDKAFWGCQSLETISIPKSVVNIGKDVFVGTKWLNNQLDGALYINNVFYKKNRTFHEKCFTIRKETVRISDSAFEDCTSLQKIIMSYGVISIGDRAFYGCTSLHDIDIPNSVFSIGKSAFQGCKSIENVDIPNSVEYIGESAYVECTSLQSIDIPNSVKNIGKCAFMWCFSLQSINIPCRIHTIECGTFQQCSSLKSVSIPNSVTTIGDVAFWGCQSLQSVNLPNGVVSIGNGAFNGTLLEKVIIPSSVECVGEDTFGNDPNLKEFVVDKDNINYLSIEGVLYKRNFDGTETYKLLKYPPMKELSNFTLNTKTTHLDSFAFQLAFKLEEIKLHDSLLDIGNKQSFFLCTSLKKIQIPPKIVKIPVSCFGKCKALEQVYIPNRDRLQIENNSFEGCVSLKELHILILKPENIIAADDAFDENTYDNCVLFIPIGTRWAYRHHPILGKFKKIEIENN